MADRITLPSIAGISEGRFEAPEQTSPMQIDAVNSSKVFAAFSQSVDRMANVNFPLVDPAAPMKVRISTLESALNEQGNHNDLAHQSFLNMSDSVNSVDQQLKGMMLSMQHDFDSKLAEMKKEYDHRFDLQLSENKRMQNHVATLKADTNQLKRKLQTTIEKLRKLQHEFGDVDEIEEESSILSPTTFASRPNTTGF